MDFKITTLIENELSAGADGKLICEHGLSLYIEAGGLKLLFDTGQTGDFLCNADCLKLDLSQLDYVILSHGHYDHTGGFKPLVKRIGNSFRLIVGSDFYHPRYKTMENSLILMENEVDEDFVRNNEIDVKYISDDVFYITEDIAVVSNFGRNVEADKPSWRFYKKTAVGYQPDEFSDEIALVLRQRDGLVLVVGCSHPGLLRIIRKVEQSFGQRIVGVIGGAHFVDAEPSALYAASDFLRAEKGLRMLALCHCTGGTAMSYFAEQFPDIFIANHTGSVLLRQEL